MPGSETNVMKRFTIVYVFSFTSHNTVDKQANFSPFSKWGYSLGQGHYPNSQNKGVPWLLWGPWHSSPVIALLCSTALWRPVPLLLCVCLCHSKSSLYIVNAYRSLIWWIQDNGIKSRAGEDRSIQCIKRSLPVADTKYVLGISLSVFLSERRTSIVRVMWLNEEQWPELLLWLLVTLFH